MPSSAWKDIVKRTYKRVWDDNVGLVAAGVAFYGFFALLSLLGLIVLVYGFVAEPMTVDLNTAGQDELEGLPMICPSRARSLIESRPIGSWPSPPPGRASATATTRSGR